MAGKKGLVGEISQKKQKEDIACGMARCFH